MTTISLNIYQIIILIGSLNGFLLSALLFARHDKKEEKLYLALLILLFALSSFKIVLQEEIPYFNYYLPVPLLYQFAFGPLLYLYFRTALVQRKLGKSRVLMHFIPSIALDVLPSLIRFCLGPAHYQDQTDKFLFLTDITAFFFFTFYVGLSIRLLLAYRLLNTSKKKTNLFNLMIAGSVFMCFTWLVYILQVLIFKGHWIYDILPYYPLYILLAVCIYGIGIAGYFLPDVGLVKLPAPERKELLTKEEVMARKGSITRLLHEHQYYRDEKLTLRKLASQLNILPNELSYIINTGFEENFNDFINNFRVNAFKEWLKEPASAKFNLLGLAYEVGFNSKASFYRAFKKSTNQTPGEFYKDRMLK